MILYPSHINEKSIVLPIGTILSIPRNLLEITKFFNSSTLKPKYVSVWHRSSTIKDNSLMFLIEAS